MNNNQPSLFGLRSSNRDFTQKKSWGKNQFNSSFPASLCCYLKSKNYDACYIHVASDKLSIDRIGIDSIFGIDPAADDIFFAFEASHSPFTKYVIGALPRTDLVVQRKSTGACLAALEVKLTALPDNTTYNRQEKYYGCEIVVRPDTIVYLACSIAHSLGDSLNDLLQDHLDIQDWTEAGNILPHIPQIIKSIKKIAVKLEEKQTPFLLQPIWKTEGKSAELAENCLDVFCWSDASFSYFIAEIAQSGEGLYKITRPVRTAIWLYKMLLDICNDGHFDHHMLIDQLSYNTKNDKAFASSGNVTNKFMHCDRLINPIIMKSEIKNIILGGGQNLLSPERRFDAIIFNTAGLFK